MIRNRDEKIKVVFELQDSGKGLTEISKSLGYSSVSSLYNLANRCCCYIIDGRIIAGEMFEKQIKNTRKFKMKKCTKCGEMFKTEVDKMGVPYDTRCQNCKQSERVSRCKIITGRWIK